MASLTEAQASASLALTTAYKTQQNREAAKVAALVALYYRQRVNVEDPRSIEAWLDLMIPRLIQVTDRNARNSATFYNALRRIEAPKATAYRADPALGMVDEGVKKSLLTVGPYNYTNKAADIRRLDVTPAQRTALLAEAKQVTSESIAAAVVRHSQAGGRQTIHANSQQDKVALGWVRVTRAQPCAFCAMLAARGIHYRPFKEGAFDMSNARFHGEGDAKVHDRCGCSLKAVFADNDPILARNETFVDLWSEWGAGGGDAALRFRRGYDHYIETGEKMSWDEANEGLRG